MLSSLLTLCSLLSAQGAPGARQGAQQRPHHPYLRIHHAPIRSEFMKHESQIILVPKEPRTKKGLPLAPNQPNRQADDFPNVK